MTEQSRRENLLLEMARSNEALGAARALRDSGFHADSVSRAYYAMLHAARALLLTEGEEPRTHGGVATLLNLRFVRTGKLPSGFTRALSRSESGRETADYDVSAVYEEEDAAEAIREADEFTATCRRYLVDTGWLAQA